ncbi:MAG: hypothetical protein RL517_533 [Pseudomonadota bacterium]|jgi:hypothetical protein
MHSSTQFGLKAWSAWSSSLRTQEEWLEWARNPFTPNGEDKPKVEGMQPMNRRRLKRLGSMALETAYNLPEVSCPIIFCSKLGESERCYELLKELAETGALSPQSFSLAVHNAIPSLYTIDKKMNSNVLAISSDAGVFSAMIEALGLFACGEEMVRIIVAEEAVPSEYVQYCEFTNESYAYAIDLVPAGDMTLSFSGNEQQSSDSPQLSTNLQAFQFLLSGERLCECAIGRTSWLLKREGS